MEFLKYMYGCWQAYRENKFEIKACKWDYERDLEEVNAIGKTIQSLLKKIKFEYHQNLKGNREDLLIIHGYINAYLNDRVVALEKRGEKYIEVAKISAVQKNSIRREVNHASNYIKSPLTAFN